MFVFGHRSPDTDSTCSALIWAWYLTEIKKSTGNRQSSWRAK